MGKIICYFFGHKVERLLGYSVTFTTIGNTPMSKYAELHPVPITKCARCGIEL